MFGKPVKSRWILIVCLMIAGLMLAGCEEEQADDTTSVNDSDPSIPTGVSASASGTTVTVTWTAVPGAVNYRVYRGPAPGVNTVSLLAGTIPDPTVTFNDPGLANGTIFYYVVTSFDGTTESVISTEVNTTTVPIPPTGPGAAPGDGQNTVTWTNSAGAASHNIYWSASDPNPTPVTGTLIAGFTSPFPHLGLFNGAVYFYVITAVNPAGESPPSAVASNTPTVTTVPCPGVSLNGIINAAPAACAVPLGTSVFTFNVVANNTYQIIMRQLPGPGDVDILVETSVPAFVADAFLIPSSVNGTTEEVVFNAPATDVYTLTLDEFNAALTNVVIEINAMPTPGAPSPGIATECNVLNNDGDSCGGGVLYRFDQAGIGNASVMLVSENAERSFVEWKLTQTGTANARDWEDGRRNIGTFNANHPASNFCQALALNGFTDWHLPSNWELWAMEWAKLNGVAIPGVTMGTFPTPTFFWSSMEDDVDPTSAAQVEFNATFDFTYISWVKDSAAVDDGVTCVRRVFP